VNAQLSAYQYLYQGTPLAWDEPSAADEPPLTFVACVSDEARLRANLLASPCLAAGSPHEVLLFRGCPSAAEGLNRGLAAAHHPWVVCLHQDVYLPRGWPARFGQQVRLAEERFGPLAAVGVYGTALRGAFLLRAGHVVDRERLLCEAEPFPATVDALDELLLAVPKAASLAFDPSLGFHLYGADLCQQARARGLASVAVDALCFHHSPHLDLPPEFAASARVLAAAWPRSSPQRRGDARRTAPQNHKLYSQWSASAWIAARLLPAISTGRRQDLPHECFAPPASPYDSLRPSTAVPMRG
jgi:hypothetical protein